MTQTAGFRFPSARLVIELSPMSRITKQVGSWFAILICGSLLLASAIGYKVAARGERIQGAKAPCFWWKDRPIEDTSGGAALARRSRGLDASGSPQTVAACSSAQECLERAEHHASPIGGTQDAIPFIEHAIALDPGNPRGHKRLASAYLNYFGALVGANLHLSEE